MTILKKNVIIHGIIDPLCAGLFEPENMMLFCASFINWCYEGEPIQNLPLQIEHKVNKKFYPNCWKIYRSYRIMAIRGNLEDKNLNGKLIPYFNVIEILETDLKSPQLEEIAQDLKNPVVITHPFFGSLTYNRSCHLFEGEAKLMGKKVSLNFKAENPTLDETLINTAKTFFDNQKIWKKTIEDRITSEILSVRNDWAKEANENEISEVQFRKKIKPISFLILPNGDFFLEYFEPFFEESGHGIEVRGNITTGISEVMLDG